MQRFALGWLLMSLAAFPAYAQGEPSQPVAKVPACDMPVDLTTPSDPLINVAGALGKTNSLNILALGSGSTVGDTGGAGGPAMAYRTPGASFPYKMQEALEAMRPGLHVQVTVKGARSMTADAMLEILRQELPAHHYDVVLWQTGTVEAVHGVRPDALRATLQEGADLAEQAHADMVLIDPQFSRFLRANADLSPYESVLQQITGNPGVTLFHRLDLTQTWVGSGQLDLERVGRDQRDKTITTLNICLGQALARFVLNGVGEH